jgi:2-keto-4-pentenoate hydratase
MKDYQAVAEVMFDAARTGQLDLDGVGAFDDLGGDPILTGLDVQLEVLRRWEATGETLGGWKVGLTSGGARDSMGPAFRPFGYVLTSRIFESGTKLPLASVPHCWLEPEIGLTMAANLRGSDLSVEQARQAVGSVHAAFEILDRRVPETARRPLIRLSDGLGQWGVVFGPGRAPDIDLAAQTVELRQGPTVVGTGTTRPDVVDDPYLSLIRVCRELDRCGLGLRAGQRVITGSLLSPVHIETPGRWEGDFGVLGAVAIDLI